MGMLAENVGWETAAGSLQVYRKIGQLRSYVVGSLPDNHVTGP
jgi:hypothetical protein